MFDEGEHQGLRTGNAPEALDQQPAEAHDRDSKSSCGSLSSSKYWLSAVLGQSGHREPPTNYKVLQGKGEPTSGLEPMNSSQHITMPLTLAV
jgi:hypothetical protein